VTGAVLDPAAAVPSAAPEPAAWKDPPRRPPGTTAPVLVVDGFEGPLDWLLDRVRAGQIDLARLSILALVDAFGAALDAALARRPDAPAPDLRQWAAWTVMAAQLTELRSRLLLPAGGLARRTAQAQAEALRRHWLGRAEVAAAADWLQRRPQLGWEVFARGQPAPGRRGSPAEGDACDGFTAAPEATPGQASDPAPVGGGDLTELLRACLVALQLPAPAESDQPRRLPFWRTRDAIDRITQLLAALPEGAALDTFVPELTGTGASGALHRRAAVAATLVAALELTRGGALTLHQDAPWQPIQIRQCGHESCDSPAALMEQGERPMA